MSPGSQPEPERPDDWREGHSVPPPPWLHTEEELRRWALSVAIAKQLFEDTDPGAVWMATRAIYLSEIKTG